MKNLIRKNILKLKSYEISKDNKKYVLLNANENPYSYTEFYRYPNLQEILNKVSKLYNVNENNIFVSNGSDGAIDILIRTFCEPKVDNILILKPSFSMYKVYADIQNIKTAEIPLTEKNNYQLDVKKISSKVNKNTKIIFISNPSAPMGHCFKSKDIEDLCKLKTIIVIDEAYIEFSKEKSFIQKLSKYKNLVILRTLSKAYGMAGLRIGFAISNPKIISYLRAVSSPYSVSSLSLKTACEYLDKKPKIDLIVKERERVFNELKKLKFLKLFKSDTNFIFIQTDYIDKIKEIMEKNSIKLRYFNYGIRISIGLKEENDKMLNVFKKMKI